jgi:hypothetical protein
MNKYIYIVLIIIALLCIYLISLPIIKEDFIILSLKEKLSIIDPKIADIDIREGNSSFTEDKTIIYLCVRDENGNYYPMNTLIYVALHEIAHLFNKDDYGHTPRFHSIFQKLLCKASYKGIYDPNLPHVSFYCGVDIRGINMPTCNIEDLDI